MKSNTTLIWDLDGTLLDSYGVILGSLEQVCRDNKFPFDKETVAKDVIVHSVNHYIDYLSCISGMPFDEIKNRCSELSRKRNMEIEAMPHAIETLKKLKAKGIDNYIFTHRGTSTEGILKNVKLYDYFIEIVTSLNNFPRKPDPTGLNYLINKYHLDPNNTYYVGDRAIDIECASNAGLKSILYKPDTNVTVPSGKETFIVKDLLDIPNLF